MLQIFTYPFVNDRNEVELVIRLERDVTDMRKMEESLALGSRELQKAHSQLEALCEISRQMSARASLGELVFFLRETISGIFPHSEPLFFLLNEHYSHFLSLSECGPHVSEPLRGVLHAMKQSGHISDFIRFLAATKVPRMLTHIDHPEIHPCLKTMSDCYPAWFGLPIMVKPQCIGYFFLGCKSPREFSREDVQFAQAMIEQVAGHLRHMVLYELEISRLRQQMAERKSYGEIIGQSKRMQEVYELIDLVARSDATVLITGENGTGKELVAKAIHKGSHRSEGPLIVANCSAYSSMLLESELFGHEKGSFTGAICRKKGRIERAQKGILFLDEIGDIAPATQILLLRFLQDHQFERVGGEKTLEADVRVLAATNRDLLKEVHMGRFRDDLYYRLNVISIHLPPLREHKEDIPLLAQHFLQRYDLKEGKIIRKFSSNVMQVLMDYEWPGNVRQLENAVSHAVILCQDEIIRRKHLPRFLKEISQDTTSTSLGENERNLILRVLKESNWNKHDTAKRLKVSRSTLYSKIRRYGLEKNAADV